MVDITRWNRFWNEIFHPRRASAERMERSRNEAVKTIEALSERRNYKPPLPEGFTVQYLMEYGFPHIILYYGGRRVSHEMVHNGDTNEAYRKVLSTAKFIAENNVDV